jgi:Family of unknown function (DUF5996)
MQHDSWPPLPYEGWKDTYATLHMWTQIVGKVALAQGPPLNHSWGIAFQVTPHGLSTRTLPHGDRSFTIQFDFVDHALAIVPSDGAARTLPLVPRTVADFHRDVMTMLDDMGLPVKIWPMPVEIPNPIRFDQDTVHRSYDPVSVGRWWQIVAQVTRVFTQSACGFIGKCSPAHFFWGSFDLAVTRFSGRPAPPREGPAFMQEAYSHEVISAGWWPGAGEVKEAAFYCYAAPAPPGFAEQKVRPAAASYDSGMGEYLMTYDRVRSAPSPSTALLDFLQSTYEAGATTGKWDREALETK